MLESCEMTHIYTVLQNMVFMHNFDSVVIPGKVELLPDSQQSCDSETELGNPPNLQVRTSLGMLFLAAGDRQTSVLTIAAQSWWRTSCKTG